MKNNLGKVFEQNLQSYAKKDGIFCMRIQDSDLSFAGGNSKFTNPSLCDFIMFYKNHIDMTPLGDVISSIVTLIQGHPDTDFLFKHILPDKTVSLDTRELKSVLGDVPLNSYEVIKWIEEYLKEQYS